MSAKITTSAQDNTCLDNATLSTNSTTPASKVAKTSNKASSAKKTAAKTSSPTSSTKKASAKTSSSTSSTKQASDKTSSSDSSTKKTSAKTSSSTSSTKKTSTKTSTTTSSTKKASAKTSSSTSSTKKATSKKTTKAAPSEKVIDSKAAETTVSTNDDAALLLQKSIQLAAPEILPAPPLMFDANEVLFTKTNAEEIKPADFIEDQKYCNYKANSLVELANARNESISGQAPTKITLAKFKKLASSIFVLALDIAKIEFSGFFEITNNNGDKPEVEGFYVPFKYHELEEIFAVLPRGCHIVFEACSTSNWLGCKAKKYGLCPHAFNASTVAGIRNADKNDNHDARAIYQTYLTSLICGPSSDIKEVVLKNEDEAALANLITLKEQSSKSLTMANNRLKAYLNEQGYKVAREESPIMYAKHLIVTKILASNARNLLLKDNEQENDLLEHEFDARVHHLIVKDPAALSHMLEAKMSIHDVVKINTTHIYLKDLYNCLKINENVDAAIKRFANFDLIAHRLMAVKGIGHGLATGLLAYVAPLVNADLSRKAILKYVGCVPKHTGTGGVTVQLGISKRGLPELRRFLYQGSMNILNVHLKAWEKAQKEGYEVRSWVIDKLARGVPRKVIAVSISNRLLQLAFIILKGKKYDQNLDQHLVVRVFDDKKQEWVPLAPPKVVPKYVPEMNHSYDVPWYKGDDSYVKYVSREPVLLSLSQYNQSLTLKERDSLIKEHKKRIKTVEAGAAISGAKLEASAKRKKAKAQAKTSYAVQATNENTSLLYSDSLPDL